MSGRRIDVAILASSNPAHAPLLRRAAEASAQEGLVTRVLCPRLGPRFSARAEDYALPGVEAEGVRTTVGAGLTAYPTHFSTPRIVRELRDELRRLQPRVVVSHIDSVGVFRALHCAAQDLGIPGVVIQEGMAVLENGGPGLAARLQQVFGRGGASWLLDAAMGRLPLRYFRAQPLNTFAAYVLAWGDAMKRLLVAAGRRADSVIVTGAPAFDDLRLVPRRGEGKPRAVLVAHQPLRDPARELAFAAGVADACAQLDAPLIFKLHRTASIAPQRFLGVMRAAAGSASAIELVSTGDVSEHYGRARVLVTAYSTAAYRAAASGLTLVLPEYLDCGYRLDAAACGAALAVREPAGLPATLARALDDSALRLVLEPAETAFLHDHLGPLDGQAGTRVARALGALAEGRGGAQ